MLYSAVVLSCLVAVQAMSIPILDDVVGYGLGGGERGLGGINSGLGGINSGLGGINSGLGGIGGINRGIGGVGGIGRGIGGIGGIGGMEQSGSQFGHRGGLASSSGYGSQGYGSEAGSSLHDIGHASHDFKQITESHVSEGHNLGHSGGYSSQGHEAAGHGHYGADNEGFGNNYYGGSHIGGY